MKVRDFVVLCYGAFDGNINWQDKSAKESLLPGRESWEGRRTRLSCSLLWSIFSGR